MSEYQYVALRAVDRPLTKTQLEYAKAFAPTAVVNEYSFELDEYGRSMVGDALGLLRHGYSVFLHYTNFGVRRIAMRFTDGLPFDATLLNRYLRDVELHWHADVQGPGGILELAPFHTPDGIDEIWDSAEYVADVIELRHRLMAADVRALYALWLCAAYDSRLCTKVMEPPVPAGLLECSPWVENLLEFFGLDRQILVAAFEASPGELQSDLEMRAVPSASSREAWPTREMNRSMNLLLERTGFLIRQQALRDQQLQLEYDSRPVERKLMVTARREMMIADPDRWIREADQLIEQGSPEQIQAATEILAELRDALGQSGDQLTRTHAAHLAQKHPTLARLKMSLRQFGLLDK